MCCSPKTGHIIKIVFFSIVFLAQGVSSALNFLAGYPIPGIGFAAAGFMVMLYLAMLLRLGYKPVAVLIQEELDSQRLTSDGNGNAINHDKMGSAVNRFSNNNVGGDVFQRRIAEAEYQVLENKTIFRSSAGFFIFMGFLVMFAALGAAGWFLYKAIEAKETFNPFEAGNQWIPFIAFLVAAPPSGDVAKTGIKVKSDIRKYFLGGSGNFA